MNLVSQIANSSGLMAIAIALLLTSTDVHSQSLEEIVVTAERRENSLQDTPISVIAIGEIEIENFGIEDVTDLGRAIPNLNINPPRGNSGNVLSFNIRGIGGVNGGVAMYIDDIYFPSVNVSTLRTTDIQSIEVLRGPQGTLFGRNNTAGAIRITTKKPNDEFAGSVTGTIGDYGRLDFEGSVNIPVTDNFFIKGQVAVLDRDGYVSILDTPGGEDYLGATSSDIISLSARYEPSDKMTVDLAVRFEDAENTPNARVANALVLDNGGLFFHGREIDRQFVNAGQGGLVNDDPRIVVGDYAVAGFCILDDNDPTNFEFDSCGTDQNSDNAYYTAALTYDINENHSLKASAGYTDIDFDFTSEWVASGAEVRFQNRLLQATTAEVILNSSLADGFVDLVSGLNFYENELVNHQHVRRNHDPDQLPDTRDIYSDVTEDSSQAVFAHAIFNLPNDSTRIQAGVRYTNDESDVVFREFESGDFNIPGCDTASSTTTTTAEIVRDPSCARGSSGGEDWSEVDWKFGIDHQINDDVMIYASASKAFRQGLFTHTVNTTADVDLSAIDPERVKSYEVGLRSEFLDNRLRLNLTYFQSDYFNRQINELVVTGNDSIQVVQVDAGEQEFSGFEFDTSLAVTDNLTLGLSGAFVDANSVDQEETSRTFLVAFTPEFSYNATLNYQKELSWAQMSLSSNYTWQDEFWVVPYLFDDDTAITPSYGVLNARASFALENSPITIAIGATNLLDETYARLRNRFSSRFWGPGGPPGNAIGTENYVELDDRGQPRMVYASITLNFD